MEIILAKHAGFCFGVRRALADLGGVLRTNREVYCLGPLVHNRQVIEHLSRQGVRTISSLDEVAGGPVCIRTHGVGPEVLEAARARGLAVADATCPFVRRVQRLAQDLTRAGYQVVVVGDSEHPEVKGIVAWTGGKAWVVRNAAEAQQLPPGGKMGVVAQTTQPQGVWREVAEVLRTKAKVLEAYNTTCQATRQRQEETMGLAAAVDVMVVVGGYDSANTRHLVEIARNVGTPTYHVEGLADLRLEWFENASRVGVTAGASTPEWIIEEVVARMQEFEETREVSSFTSLASGEEARAAMPEDDTSGEEPRDEAEGREGQETASQPGEPMGAEEPQGAEEQSEPSMQAMRDVQELHRGDVIKGTVVQISDNEVMVDVGGKSEGIIPLGELGQNKVEDPHQVVNVGDVIDVYVLRSENEEGHPVLSKRRANRIKAWGVLEEAYQQKEELQAPVVEVVKGGLLVDLGIRGFVPASLIEMGYVENLQDYLGRTLRLRVIELDRSKNKVVLSQKAILEEEARRRREETWNDLEEGQIRRGVVRRLTNFGAFVDLGGVDGLLHVSEVSWGRVDHPRDVLSEGQEIEVKVLGVDRERGRVSLGLKHLHANPWDTAAERYPVGTVVEGKVLRLAPFGAFVEIEPGIEGLVHISQLAERHVEKPADVVSVGDKITVKVLKVDQEAQRMSLSLREAMREKKRQEVQNRTPDEDVAGVRIGELFGDLFEDHGE
ncbi:MAG: bifunctional 4-hydroxy-3-methylbut-2-enyl diphosphate reductase/30S ribosomal protein S1 [Clostridia bacterium]|nr:MAG: bifunctional 4-hydroxy-3-methylbut-2-enyl diphosphate reductase/30S ribosomal protein S1 [Clostridia bacterium]